MPGIWDGCVKIHEGCGGVCRWVEAIKRPSVGYHGECTYCGRERIPTEHMIPLESFTHREVLRVAPTDALAGLEWEEHDDWEANQARLNEIVSNAVRTPDHRRALTDGGPAKRQNSETDS